MLVSILNTVVPVAKFRMQVQFWKFFVFRILSEVMDVLFVVFNALIALTLFCVSAVITHLVLRLDILDEPNIRSSHSRPTPSTGGIAIVLTFLLGALIVIIFPNVLSISRDPYLGLFFALMVIALVGLLDDLKVFNSFKAKLIGQVIAASMLISSGFIFDQVWLPLSGVFDLGWIGYPIALLWLVMFTNIFNFMDGLNGLAGGTAILAAIFLLLIASLESSPVIYVFCYAIAASIGGFFIFNFPHGRIFMGDVGSQFVGFAFGAMAIYSSQIDVSKISILVIPLLFFNFLFDTLFTICRRFCRGEKITEAHRTHLYQLLNQLGWSHVQVSLFHFFFTCVQGIGVLVFVNTTTQKQIGIIFGFFVMQMIYASMVLYFVKRRKLLN